MTGIEGILPKGPYLPCVSMAGRALLAGYHRYDSWCSWKRIARVTTCHVHVVTLGAVWRPYVYLPLRIYVIWHIDLRSHFMDWSMSALIFTVPGQNVPASKRPLVKTYLARSKRTRVHVETYPPQHSIPYCVFVHCQVELNFIIRLCKIMQLYCFTCSLV